MKIISENDCSQFYTTRSARYSARKVIYITETKASSQSSSLCVWTSNSLHRNYPITGVFAFVYLRTELKSNASFNSTKYCFERIQESLPYSECDGIFIWCNLPNIIAVVVVIVVIVNRNYSIELFLCIAFIRSFKYPNIRYIVAFLFTFSLQWWQFRQSQPTTCNPILRIPFWQIPCEE